MTEPADRLRIDKWLWAARFFKTRSLAAQAVDGGRVQLNRARVKPAYGLPFHKLPKQLDERQYQLHEAALNCFRIGTHPGS